MPAAAEKQTLLPPAFQNEAGAWNVMTLRAATAKATLEQEFAQLKTMQQEESARMRGRVRWMKRIALGITVVVLLLVVAWAVVMLKYGPKMLGGH